VAHAELADDRRGIQRRYQADVFGLSTRLLVVWRQEVAQPATAATNPRVTQTGDYIFRACFTDDFQAVVIVRFVLNIGACAAET